jgi:putative heme-binding domain-containing protein
MLRSPDFHARAAATRVLCYWRDRVREPLELLRTQINDAHPRVRLEAIRALSFFHEEEALNVALEMLTHPDDQYLAYTFNETLNTLERRLGGGAKLDRKNIAVSLLKILDKEKIPDQRKPALIETITRHGGAKELTVIWQQAAKPGVYSPALRRQIFGWLADAAALRRAQPAVDASAVQALLTETAGDAALRAEAIRLAAAWKVGEAAETLGRIADDSKSAPPARFAAIDALPVLSGAKSAPILEGLAGPPHDMAVRFRAALALATVDIGKGAEAAAGALAAATDQDDSGPVVEGLLARKGGSDRLAAALVKQKLSVDAAKRILRSMLLAGRNDAALASVAGKFAGIEAAAKPPTPQEVAKIVAEVQGKGDAGRGERVFRRADLGCMNCHAIGKAGGAIGPDLGPVGAASPLDYIVTSILDPSLSIKEEYLTKVIETSSGRIVTGIPILRDKNQVVLKDATGKHIKIAVADIENESNGKSLMPEGITRFLTKGELLDLIRFVSELGKPGPYALRTAATIQRWRKLRDVPAALSEGIPNRELVRGAILGASPDAWDTVYAMVNGTLPLEELSKPGQGKVVYLQGEVQVSQGGAVEVLVETAEPATFWIDEDVFEKQSKATVPLSPGRHRITVRTAAAANSASTLRLELRKPADSKASFAIVHSD